MGVVLPVPPEVRASVHAALEYLGSGGGGGGTVSLWALAHPARPAGPCQPMPAPCQPRRPAPCPPRRPAPASPTSQPPPSVSMSQNTSSGRARSPLRKMVVVLELPAPFCISSPQSRGKGTCSPPGGGHREGQSSFQTADPCCPRSPCPARPGTGGEGGGHGRREALAPHGAEPGSVGGGGEEAPELVRGGASREQDLLWAEKGRSGTRGGARWGGSGRGSPGMEQGEPWPGAEGGAPGSVRQGRRRRARSRWAGLGAQST